MTAPPPETTQATAAGAPVPVSGANPAPPRGGLEPAGVLRATGLFAGRALRRALRDPQVLVPSVAFPAVLMLVLLAAFATYVGEVIEGDYVDRVVPLMVLTGGAFGSVGVAIAIARERYAGFVDRLRALPVSPVAFLAGRVVADVARALAVVVVLVTVGHVVGFRFDNGVAGALGFFGVAAVAASGFAWIALAVGLGNGGADKAQGLNGLYLMLLFTNGGFVPVEAFPGWIQPVVRANPYTVSVETLTSLAGSGRILVPFLATVAWVAAAWLVAAPAARRRMARAT